jgi:hypothetical protein
VDYIVGIYIFRLQFHRDRISKKKTYYSIGIKFFFNFF